MHGPVLLASKPAGVGPTPRRATAVVAVAVAVACASCLLACRPDEPPYDPLAYLAIGVDTQSEAMTEERSLHERGFAITHRVDGRDFVALGARSPREGAYAVRIITSRGIAMGVDAPVRDRPTWRSVTLLEGVSGRDLDGDDEAELLIRIDDSIRPLPCLVIVRVRARGDAFEVPVDARAYGPRACPEDLVDVEGDGQIELLVGYRPWVVPGAPVPSMPIAFHGQAGTWQAASEGTASDLAVHAVAERIEARNQALARGDGAEAARLAVEILWLDGTRAIPLAERLAAFDESLATATLDAPSAALVAMARARVASGE